MTRVDVELLSDPVPFSVRARPLIEADPFSSNVMAVVLARAQDSDSPIAVGATWILAARNGGVVAAAMHTPPYNPFLPRMPEGAAAAIAAELSRVGHPVKGVNGETAAVEEFAARWIALNGGVSSVTMSMRLYRLRELRVPMDVPGSARYAERGDTALIADWLGLFQAESVPHSPNEDFDEMARERIARREVWLWEHNDHPVSVAMCSPAAAGVARVGPVYTPPKRRGCGFGAAVTARATRAGLDCGAAHVVLYTDLANPISNSIYQRIGYEPEFDAQLREFGP